MHSPGYVHRTWRHIDLAWHLYSESLKDMERCIEINRFLKRLVLKLILYNVHLGTRAFSRGTLASLSRCLIVNQVHLNRAHHSVSHEISRINPFFVSLISIAYIYRMLCPEVLELDPGSAKDRARITFFVACSTSLSLRFARHDLKEEAAAQEGFLPSKIVVCCAPRNGSCSTLFVEVLPRSPSLHAYLRSLLLVLDQPFLGRSADAYIALSKHLVRYDSTVSLLQSSSRPHKKNSLRMTLQMK